MTAADRLAAYDKANPGKSSREAAAALGLSHTTVQDARRSGGNQFPPEPDSAETVTGKDNKQYPARRDGDSLEYGRKQVARLKKYYGDSPNPLPPIQYDLLDQVKPTILQMNWWTKHALAQWLGEVYHAEFNQD